MRLPLSGLDVDFREPDGEAEALIAESPPDRPVAASIALLERLCFSRDGEIRPDRLTLTDFETALVGLRRHWLGADAASHPYCSKCGERVELSFSLDALAESATPRAFAGARALPGGGEIDGVRFRLPTAGDARAAECHADAPERLLASCVEDLPGPAGRRRIESAIAGFAPLLSRALAVRCAACRAMLRAVIHVPSFVVDELTSIARSIFEDVHLIAKGYGWREAEILALPRLRRQRYAARIRAGV